MQQWKSFFTEYSWFAEFLINRNKIPTTDMSLSNLIVKCLLSCFMVEHDFQCWSIEDSFMREELHVQLYKIFLKRKFFQLNSFPCKIWVKKVFFFSSQTIRISHLEPLVCRCWPGDRKGNSKQFRKKWRL